MAVRNNRKNGKYWYLDSEAAWEYIEMGKDLDTLYPEEWGKSPTMPKSYLLPGEKYHFLPNKFYQYAITSNARVISFAQLKPKQMVPTLLPYTVSINGGIQGVTLNVCNRLKEYGWDKNVSEIYDIYMKYKWKFYVSSGGTITIYNDIHKDEK